MIGRYDVYAQAFDCYGKENQCIVAIEELSECQKEICKHLRGDGNIEHIAEEVADAAIMLEQLCMMFSMTDCVCNFMEQKVLRLKERMKERMKEG